MKVRLNERAVESYETAPRPVQKAFDKQFHLLEQNLLHPSLRAKKYDETRGVWQARVNKYWRFYFRIEGDTYHILDIILHPK
jgi:mRNA-degrading endonuclease RelE of RelBE toxin-antitoxin system